MQDEDTTQEVNGNIIPSLQVPPPPPHVPMTAPPLKKTKKSNKKEEHDYTYFESFNCSYVSRLSTSLEFFFFMTSYITRPYDNWQYPRVNRFYDEDYILECTIANINFKDLKSRYNFRTYTKHFEFLVSINAILKVNPNNIRCCKYYVNPEYFHKLNTYASGRDSPCEIYYKKYRHMWVVELANL